MKKIVALLLAAAILAAFAGCAGSQPPASSQAQPASSAAPSAAASSSAPEAPAAEKRVLTFAHVFQTTHPVHIALVEANESLKAKTDGRLELEIFPNSTYAAYNDAVSAVQTGTLDMAALDSAADWLPKAGVVLGPYVFRSYDHWSNFKKSDIYNELRAEVSEAVGVVQLDMYQFGFRHLTGNKIYRSTADFKGDVLRVVNFPPYSELAVIFDAAVTATPIAEVYMALSSGVVNTQENPVTQITTMKFYEVQEYLMLTAHMLAVSSTIISEKAWNSLSAEDQEIIREVFKAEADRIDQIVVENEAALIQECVDGGMTLVDDIDTTPFKERVPMVLDKYPEWVDLYNQIQDIDG